MKTEKIIFNPNGMLPDRETEGESESKEVKVLMEGETFDAYYDYDSRSWWVHFGGMTVGHRKTDREEIEGWFYNEN